VSPKPPSGPGASSDERTSLAFLQPPTQEERAAERRAAEHALRVAAIGAAIEQLSSIKPYARPGVLDVLQVAHWITTGEDFELKPGPDPSDFGEQLVNALGEPVMITTQNFGQPLDGGDGGDPLRASLNRPFGVAFDARGDLFIADTYNNRIRKVTR
jgi:hypothetical protein